MNKKVGERMNRRKLAELLPVIIPSLIFLSLFFIPIIVSISESFRDYGGRFVGLENYEAMFNDGAHDRVFTGMLNGAVVVSEYSSYLDELFENQSDLFMFDWQNTKEQMEVIFRLLGDEHYRMDIARNAYGKVVKSQTWENRSERILEAVELFRQ